MTNTVRSFQVALIDTNDGSVIRESEFLGTNPMHAAFLAGVNVGLNMADSPFRAMMGNSYLSTHMATQLRERDIQIVKDNGVITDAQVDEYLNDGTVPSDKSGEGSVDPAESFNLEEFLQQIINEIDDES